MVKNINPRKQGDLIFNVDEYQKLNPKTPIFLFLLHEFQQ